MKNDFDINKERDRLLQKDNIVNYDEGNKKSITKFLCVFGVLIIISLILIVCFVGNVVKKVEVDKSTVLEMGEILEGGGIKDLFSKNDEGVIRYVKEKYGLEAKILEVDETYSSLEKTVMGKEKLFYVDTEKDAFSILKIGVGDNATYYDNFEEELVKQELEKYIEEKIGVDCTIEVFAGKRPEDIPNLFNERYEDITTLVKDYDLFIVVETALGLINLDSINRDTFVELFPADSLNNRAINKKIILSNLRGTGDEHVFLTDNYVITNNNENEWNWLFKKFNFLYQDIKVISNHTEKVFSADVLEKDGLYYFNGDVKGITDDEDAKIEKILNYKEDLNNFTQKSKKYIIETNVPENEFLHVAVRIEDLGLDRFNIRDIDKLYQLDAIEKEEDGSFDRVFCLPYGEYLIFDLKPVNNRVEFFIVEEKF